MTHSLLHFPFMEAVVATPGGLPWSIRQWEKSIILVSGGEVYYTFSGKEISKRKQWKFCCHKASQMM